MAISLQEYLKAVGETYFYPNAFDTAAEPLILDGPASVVELVGELTMRGSVGQKPLLATRTPWVGFFATGHKPQRGIYVVYLFHAPDERGLPPAVTLSLNQGTEKVSLKHIRDATPALRALVPPLMREGWDETFEIGHDTGRQLKYQLANIVSRTYSLRTPLPSDNDLRNDLEHAISMYRILLSKANAFRAAGEIVAPKPKPKVERKFKPKSVEEYKGHYKGGSFTRTPNHEVLVNEYAEWLDARNMDAASEHPRDLTATLGDIEFLIEAKIVGEASQFAAREVVGQLFEYAHFYYDQGLPQPIKVALFDQDVGAIFRGFLDTLGIAVVWRSFGGWLGDDRAVSMGLCGPDIDADGG